ncbi:MAG: hypothetical protein Q8S73_30540 [Deltaproteobacteria bacterium]|nr:hypothetical protein [Myxococcales bacterium]MDP3218483.1 hypothetical protein [Deltaproteobacteria bacterium]
MSVFWPTDSELGVASWAAQRAWVDGPTYGVLIRAMCPVLRVLFMLGHQTISIKFGIGALIDESDEWSIYSVEDRSFSTDFLAIDRTYEGINVVFELIPLGHFDGTSYAIPPPSVTLGSSDTPAGYELPADLLAARDRLLSDCARLLADQVSDRNSLLGPHRGLAWIFDPAWWVGQPAQVDDESQYDPIGNATQLVDALLRMPFEFILSQAYGDRNYFVPGTLAARYEVPSLWQMSRPQVVEKFWHGVYESLRRRGLAHLLRISDRRKLDSPQPPSVLETVVRLLELGVIAFEGVFEPDIPAEPLVERVTNDNMIELLVWGETPIVLTRTGKVAWDYVHGDSEHAPRVIIVAGRGVSIEYPTGTRLHDQLYGRQDHPWILDIYRVQDDALIPPLGTTIDVTALLIPVLIDDDQPNSGRPRRLAVHPIRNGLYLQYPFVGDEPDAIENPDENRPLEEGEDLPFSVRVTVKPTSGSASFMVDVRYYTYFWGSPYGFPRPGAHICIWTRGDVTVEASGVSVDQHVRTFTVPSRFECTVECWSFETEARLGAPWRATFVDATIFWGKDMFGGILPSIEFQRMNSDTRLISVEVLGSDLLEDARLRPQEILKYQARYDDSIYMDVFDILIGVTPIGDVVDVIETGNAWLTGRDKWGRPVSTFELALMTIGAAVPVLGSGFVRHAGNAVVERTDALIPVVRGGKGRMMDQLAAGLVLPDERLVRELDDASKRSGKVVEFFRGDEKKDLADDFIDWAKRHPDDLEVIGRRLVTDADSEWLSLADVLSPDNEGFILHSLNTSYQRWKKSHTGGIDEFIGEASNDVAARFRALLGRRGVTALRKARRVPRRKEPFPTRHARSVAGGPPIAVADIRATELLEEFQGFLDHAKTGSDWHVFDGIGLVLAQSGVPPDAFGILGEGIERLFRSVSASGTLDGAALVGLLGDGPKVSVAEHGARLVEALLAAAVDFDKLRLPTDLLFSERFLPALRTYVRAMCTKNGYEHGIRLELRMVGVAEHFFPPETCLHQLRLPDKKGVLSSGPDLVVFSQNLASFVQMKAHTRWSKLGLGRLRFPNNIPGDVFIGPEICKQALGGELRAKTWSRKVPGPGAVLPTTVNLPTNLAGWVDVGWHHTFILDDEFLANNLFDDLADTSFRKGRRVLSPDDLAVPKDIRRLLRETLGDSIDVSDGAALRDRLDEWTVRMAEKIEDNLNREMQRADVVKLLDLVNKPMLEYRVLRASDVEANPALLRGTP